MYGLSESLRCHRHLVLADWPRISLRFGRNVGHTRHCPHGYTSSGSFCVPSQSAQDLPEGWLGVS
jgi:hypothetical protein